MDDAMPKLPRYVFRRANGSYRYKRNVPKELRVIFGKDTLYRQLGNTVAEALKEYPYVHARIEALFELERKKPDRERALDVIRANLGDEAADLVLARAVPEYPPLDYDLNELAYSLAGKVPKAVLEQVYQGQLKDPPVTLSSALNDYLEYKASEEGPDRDLRGRVDRLRKEITHLFGKAKMDTVALADISRQDATALRDVLLEKMAPNSVQRVIGTVKAAVNHAIIEGGLNIPNVFAKLRIKGAGASRQDRLPISEEQLQALLSKAQNHTAAYALVVFLADTGARRLSHLQWRLAA
ncbi:MAG: integrase [Rhodobacteraceae bacterium]|nr:integrase [Paracoccaceae bacterium]